MGSKNTKECGIIIEEVHYKPVKTSKKNREEEESLVEKTRDEWTEDDKRMFSCNTKAMNFLYCALSRSEYNHISACESAKHIWRMLEVKHEGTDQVKDSKINMLVHDYELFKMESGESVSNMYGRLINIVNDLNGLGKVYSSAEQVQKILRSLPKE
ncbi:uncharacterized protein LOC119998540 [Tripterygium wilfordii]|uniref:uncharacterized protein LOC119998540 n=1 Tax=Tripterygium wilfordii TaxID=458696 RepID=UPI0018F8589B|nr:uncharacterized protein LOC119998540 [Tripterygium wilfordii]